MSYAEVNGLQMYYEVHGTGPPIVALHGGLLTIDLSFGDLLPSLAASRQVIAVELQGHGRTADIDREPLLENLASDVVTLLDQLGIERADLFGFSLGGLVSLTVAALHPERVGHLVLGSTHFRQDGYYEEIVNQDPDSTRGPTEQEFQEWHDTYVRIAPDPDHFWDFAARLSGVVHSFPDWTAAELRAITAPTLLVVGDHDFIRLEHAAEMRELIPNARLAVLPDTVHTAVMHRIGVLLPIVEEFLPAQ